MASKTIVGIKTIKTKTGNTGYEIFYTEPFSQYEADTSESIHGLSCGREYSRKDFSVKVGDVVNMIYEKGFQDRAQLVDIQIVKKG